MRGLVPLSVLLLWLAEAASAGTGLVRTFRTDDDMVCGSDCTDSMPSDANGRLTAFADGGSYIAVWGADCGGAVRVAWSR